VKWVDGKETRREQRRGGSIGQGLLYTSSWCVGSRMALTCEAACCLCDAGYARAASHMASLSVSPMSRVGSCFRGDMMRRPDRRVQGVWLLTHDAEWKSLVEKYGACRRTQHLGHLVALGDASGHSFQPNRVRTYHENLSSHGPITRGVHLFGENWSSIQQNCRYHQQNLSSYLPLSPVLHFSISTLHSLLQPLPLVRHFTPYRIPNRAPHQIPEPSCTSEHQGPRRSRCRRCTLLAFC
jgi:hypothetical protein